MNNILITNTTKPTTENLVQQSIVDDWKVVFDPKTVKPGKVLVEGDILGWEYSFNKPDVRKIEPYSQATVLTQEQFDIWKSSKFETMVLLLLLVIDNPETDDYESIAWDYPQTATDWLLRAIIPNCCACGDPDNALASITRVMATFGNYPGGCGDHSVYDHGSDLAVAYQIDARSKFIEHGSSIGSSWLEVAGVVWSLAAMMEMGGNPRIYEESLPSPIANINYHTIKNINHILGYIGFMKYCIDAIKAGTTYEELWEEEGGHEESGCMWYIHVRNASPVESVKSIREDINREYEELMRMCGTKTWEDTKVVLSKVANFNQKGLQFVYKGS